MKKYLFVGFVMVGIVGYSGLLLGSQSQEQTILTEEHKKAIDTSFDTFLKQNETRLTLSDEEKKRVLEKVYAAFQGFNEWNDSTQLNQKIKDSITLELIKIQSEKSGQAPAQLTYRQRARSLWQQIKDHKFKSTIGLTGLADFIYLLYKKLTGSSSNQGSK